MTPPSRPSGPPRRTKVKMRQVASGMGAADIHTVYLAASAPAFRKRNSSRLAVREKAQRAMVDDSYERR
jgi:hypothetical protein